MKCEKCGNENSTEDKYCTKCGNELNNNELQELPMDSKEDEVLEESTNEQEKVEEQQIEETPIEEKTTEEKIENKEEVKEIKPRKRMNLLQYFAIIAIVSFIVGGIVYFSTSISLKKYKQLALKNSPYVEVKLDGFTYKIPQEYNYEKDSDYISITDKNEQWIIQIGSTKSSYDILKSNKALLQSTFEKDGIGASIPKIQNIKDKEYLTLELDENSKKSLVAYSKFNSMFINVVLVRNTSNSYDYDKLEIANDIINNSTFNDEELEILDDSYNLDDVINATNSANKN